LYICELKDNSEPGQLVGYVLHQSSDVRLVI